jgi:hypothetical protein
MTSLSPCARTIQQLEVVLVQGYYPSADLDEHQLKRQDLDVLAEEAQKVKITVVR